MIILVFFQGKKVIVILELDVLTPGSEVGQKIGQPVTINADGTVNSENLPKQQQPTGLKRNSSEPKDEPPMKKPLQVSFFVFPTHCNQRPKRQF